MKEPGKSVARRERQSPKMFRRASYLAALVPGVAGAAFVGAGVLVLELSLQPANIPTKPNSTIRVSNLFIVGVTFTKTAKRTSKIFQLQKMVGKAGLDYYHEPPRTSDK